MSSLMETMTFLVARSATMSFATHSATKLKAIQLNRFSFDIAFHLSQMVAWWLVMSSVRPSGNKTHTHTYPSNANPSEAEHSRRRYTLDAREYNAEDLWNDCDKIYYYRQIYNFFFFLHSFYANSMKNEYISSFYMTRNRKLVIWMRRRREKNPTQKAIPEHVAMTLITCALFVREWEREMQLDQKYERNK